MEEQNNKENSMPKKEEREEEGNVVKKLVALAVVVALIALGVYALTRGSGGNDQNQITPEAASVEREETTETPLSSVVPAPGANPDEVEEKVVAPAEEPASEQPLAPKTVTVTYTESGYSPQTITIKKGDSILFKNASASETWPASALHPTHTVYPGSDIKKCGTAEAASIFDACRGLKDGESWTFQFNEVGTWKYHDHLNPTKFGSITVEE